MQTQSVPSRASLTGWSVAVWRFQALPSSRNLRTLPREVTRVARVPAEWMRQSKPWRQLSPRSPTTKLMRSFDA